MLTFDVAQQVDHLDERGGAVPAVEFEVGRRVHGLFSVGG